MRNAVESVIEVRSLHKSFRTLDAEVVAADDVDLSVARGTIVGLTGPSGSGKSTLLHLIGGLDEPDSGTIVVDGQEITALKPSAKARYRSGIGFVFQRFNLIPALSVIDNVLVPLVPEGVSKDDVARAESLLESVGLGDRHHTLATRLSGGQQQRVAIARALINRPSIVLADEPTGNLDSHTGADIVKFLFRLRAEQDVTMMIATHDTGLARLCDRTVQIRDGRLAADSG
jgi:putative ABC transport system ATP-binding protein